MRVCHFEDRWTACLEPLTATRPAFDLLCGHDSLAAKQARYFGADATGALIRPVLANLCRLEHPDTPVNDLDWLRAGPTVLVNGRWLPPPGRAADLPGECVAVAGEEVAYAVLGREQLAACATKSLDDCLETWQDILPHREAGGALVRHAWDLIEHNAAQIGLDFENDRRAAPCPEGVAVVGPRERLRVDPTARLEPQVVVNTTGGPVTIDQGTLVQAFTRLEGPCYVGPHCVLLGARLRAGTTLGPHCRVGGEVEASILHGYANKYHDGFLGHSYLGAWVNLGAGTNTSDLRNDYGHVTFLLNGKPVKTGRTKVGSFLGDHARTGLGTLLNTGSNIGAFCNLLPAGPLMPKYLPPFTSWWNGTLRDTKDVAGALDTAATVMRRRGQEYTAVHAAFYRRFFDMTAAERRRALQEAEVRGLRRSA